MNVALYQEGETWESPNIIRIFVSMEVAIFALPVGFEIQELTTHYVTAMDKSRERWATIKTYEVEGTA